jgi:toxin ParE1/3/4
LLDIVYSVRAAADLRDIYKFGFRRFGQAQAERYDSDLRRASETIAQFPESGRVYVSAKGAAYRRFGCGRHVIFYRVEPTAIFIGRILHDRMDFDRHL